MGRVYRARQLGPDRDVALKVVKRDDAVPTGRARFRDEASILARLRHPNIVTLYDFVEADDADGGVDYLAMELVEGVGLDELMRERGRLPWRQACSIAAQIASALDHAHGRGVVHRDLKPANIAILEESGDDVVVRVLDFGVAKLMGPVNARNRTRPGFVVGTPAYMAPEQERGEVKPSIDVYALGVLTYEAVVGKLPTGGPVTFGDVELDPEFMSLLTRLLEATAEARPSAAEAAQGFASLLRSPEAERSRRGRGWRRSASAIAVVAALFGGALGGGAIVDATKAEASDRSGPSAATCSPGAVVRQPHVAEVGLSPAAPSPVRSSEGARAVSKAPAAKAGPSGSARGPAPSAHAPTNPPTKMPPNVTVFSTDGPHRTP
jgi:serine/threonine protein kinase